MKSRSDVAEGKPYGVWFPPRNGDASLVRLTKADTAPNLSSNENEQQGGEEVDEYAADRAAAFDS